MNDPDHPSTSSNSGGRGSRVMLGTATGLGMGIIVCGLTGYYIDSKLGGDKQYWTLGGIGVGLIYLAYEVWKLVRVAERDDRPEDDS